MDTESSEILSLVSLKIGYSSGGQENLLLPPLNACAAKGELVAVIGRNGIGKSTLLRTLTGLQPSLGGEVFYSGKNIKSFTRTDLARKVGYISTEQVKVSNMSVYDLVALGRFPHTNWIGKIDDFNQKVIIDSIIKTGMYGLRKRYIYQLSDGERQRAMIARILAQDTDIMIMDEPTAFLDIGSKYEILHLMHQLSRESGKTIVFSTHDLHMAITRSDKIWLFLENDLVEGAPEDLLISGSFDHLFEKSPVRFNATHGTFTFKSDDKGTIFIQGKGKLKHWTEMAVNRAGFSVSEVPSTQSIIVPDKSNMTWILRSGNTEKKLGSLYELVRSLTAEAI